MVRIRPPGKIGGLALPSVWGQRTTMTAREWSGVIEDVRRAMTPRGRAQLGQFVVEGARLVSRAVKSGHMPRRVVVSDRLLRQRQAQASELLEELARSRCEVITVPEAVMLELGEGRNGGQLMALCEIPRPPPLSEIPGMACARSAPVLVLVDVEEPGNVGALVRTALASDAVAIVAVGVSDPFHPKAVRTSMGSLFKLPVVHHYEVQPVLAELASLRCIAAVAEDGVAPWDADYGTATALFVGSEGKGLPISVTEVLHERVTIPMRDGVDSFSVNAAAAILLYEVNRRRKHGA